MLPDDDHPLLPADFMVSRTPRPPWATQSDHHALLITVARGLGAPPVVFALAPREIRSGGVDGELGEHAFVGEQLVAAAGAALQRYRRGERLHQ